MRDGAKTRRDGTPMRLLRVASLAEGTTLLLLTCVAVPLRHVGGIRAATEIAGPVHGVAFLAFCWLAINAATGEGWGAWRTARLLLAACLPFGGFLNARALRIAEQRRAA